MAMLEIFLSNHLMPRPEPNSCQFSCTSLRGLHLGRFIDWTNLMARKIDLFWPEHTFEKNLEPDWWLWAHTRWCPCPGGWRPSRARPSASSCRRRRCSLRSSFSIFFNCHSKVKKSLAKVFLGGSVWAKPDDCLSHSVGELFSCSPWRPCASSGCWQTSPSSWRPANGIKN